MSEVRITDQIVMSSIAVKHNIEVAHRLFELPGKCEQIHGHSMQVTMELYGEVNSKGILGGIEFGDLKTIFRRYLDEEYDHRLLLNAADPFSRPLFAMERSESGQFNTTSEQVFLPGLQSMPGDPTTENISKWIAHEMQSQLFKQAMHRELHTMVVSVWETSVNMAKTQIYLGES